MKKILLIIVIAVFAYKYFDYFDSIDGILYSSGILSTTSSIGSFPSKINGHIVNKKGGDVKLYPTHYYLLYFSAHWCGPCRAFTPKLAAFYKQRKTKNNFQVIFVSGDKSSREMYSYMNEMPWSATPFMGTLSKDLRTKYASGFIPNLKVLDKNGKVILGDGDASPDSVLNSFGSLLNEQRLTPQQSQNSVVKKTVKSPSIFEQIKSFLELFRSAEDEESKVKQVEAIKPGEFVLSGIAGPPTNRYAVINGEIYKTGSTVRAGVILEEVQNEKVILSCDGKFVDLKYN